MGRRGGTGDALFLAAHPTKIPLHPCGVVGDGARIHEYAGIRRYITPKNFQHFVNPCFHLTHRLKNTKYTL